MVMLSRAALALMCLLGLEALALRVVPPSRFLLPHRPAPRLEVSNSLSTSCRSPLAPLFSEYTGADDFEFPTEMESVAMELEMAQAQFDELRGGNAFLPLESFMQWEDITEVLARGTVDLAIVQEILVEVGMQGERLSFEQFFEAVDLVNQMTLALETGDDMFGDEEDDDDDFGDGPDGPEDYSWIMEAAETRLG
ncbi:hypothetical protein B484DRAFT_455476 [Ochromonadaceae sp. CCMP2298]|nr:hypothetical protein B484DRAFT_455476 [Ochromonadaceae sp. CCMP2298]